MSHPDARPITIGLVGLGVIGRVHLDVLSSDPRVALSFISDPLVESSAVFSPARHGAFHVDLAAALDAVRRGEAAEPDVIVLATPTRTHLDLASEVLSGTNSAVLSEKPLSGDARALEYFEGRHPEASDRLRVVNHFAFSPEVEWAAQFVARHAWATPSTVLSTFNDPYAKKPAADQATYVSSWIDSGPNQIGLLARFVSGCAVRTHTASPDGMGSVTEVDYEGGVAILTSNWLTGDSSKQTSLRWPGGRELSLDHTAMTGVAIDGGRPVGHLGHTGATDRKTAHYAAMYQTYLTDPSSSLLSLAFARSTAELLHTATISAPPISSIDWRISTR